VRRKIAILATALLAGLMCLQALLAAGLPLGGAAWGGQYDVLPTTLRWGSFVAFFILGGAAWVILARADLVAPGARSLGIRIAVWVFGAYLILNTVGNIASTSRFERQVLTPVSLLLAVCFFIVAASRDHTTPSSRQ
jgi:hypothetical protein